MSNFSRKVLLFLASSTFTVSVGNQRCRVFKFQFSIDSITKREAIKQAELRLYVSPSKSKADIAAKVSIVQNVTQGGRDAFTLSSKRLSAMSPSLIVYGGSSQWVTFSVTGLVQSHLRNNQKLVNLNACVKNIYQNEMLNNFYIESLDAEYSPVLVIYSNERKRRKRASRDKQDLIAKEVVLDRFRSSKGKDRIRPADAIEGNIGRQKKAITMKPRNSSYGTTSKRKWRQRRRKFRSERRINNGRGATTEYSTHPVPTFGYNVSTSKHYNISTILKDSELLQGDDPMAVSDRSGRVARTLEGTKTRNKGRKRPRKKTPCSRSSMVVDFEEIGWDSWIIAPKKYDVSTTLSIIDQFFKKIIYNDQINYLFNYCQTIPISFF